MGDTLKGYYKKYYENNKEAHRKRQREWLRKNPEYVRTKRNKREARINNNPNTLTPAEWKEILELYEGKCIYCGSSKRITMDHIIPISKGGGTTKDNVVPACISCNSSKGNKDIF